MVRTIPGFLTSGDGCRVTDLDGHTYVDLVSEYSAGFDGHSDEAIATALVDVIQGGIMLGAPNRYEARLAAAVVDRFPAIERVRFCNSGTEANIMAISAARAITQRSKILAFREGYHGGVLTFAHGGSARRWPPGVSSPAFPHPGAAGSLIPTTKFSTASATRSRTCSPNSRTGGASPHATTDAPTPSSRPSASQQPSSSGSDQ